MLRTFRRSKDILQDKDWHEMGPSVMLFAVGVLAIPKVVG